MNGGIYRVIRDLHLYLGLFISPFVLVFSISVFFLVHAWLPQAPPGSSMQRHVTDLALPDNLETFSGRPLIEALKPILAGAGVQGEIGFVRHLKRERQFIAPISMPGKEIQVTIDVARRAAAIEERVTGFADAMVVLHKSPGPHLAGIRMNWIYMYLWRWLTDATVFLLLFLSLSGVYLWWILRAERAAGLYFLAAGALTFFGIAYALCS